MNETFINEIYYYYLWIAKISQSVNGISPLCAHVREEMAKHRPYCMRLLLIFKKCKETYKTLKPMQ